MYATVRSRRPRCYGWEAVSAHFSLAPKSRFPEMETARGRDSVRMPLRRRKSEHLMLPRPLGGHFGEAGHSHAMRQPARDGCVHEIGRQEGKRDRHVDFPNAALLALGDAFRICVRVGKKFVEPAPDTAPPKPHLGHQAGGAGSRSSLSARN